MKKAKAAYHHGDLRQTLLTSAFKLVEKEGLENLSIRKLARAAGVTHAAPYAHFKDKEGIVAALKGEAFQSLYDTLAKASAEEKSAKAKLLSLGRAYVGFQMKYPSKFQIMFRSPLERADETRADVKIGILIFDLLAKAMESFVGKNARAHALTAWALVHGLVSLWIDGPLGYILAVKHTDTKQFEKQAENAMLHFLDSISQS